MARIMRISLTVLLASSIVASVRANMRLMQTLWLVQKHRSKSNNNSSYTNISHQILTLRPTNKNSPSVATTSARSSPGLTSSLHTTPRLRRFGFPGPGCVKASTARWYARLLYNIPSCVAMIPPAFLKQTCWSSELETPTWRSSLIIAEAM